MSSEENKKKLTASVVCNARKAARLSRRDVAKSCNVGTTTLFCIELGQFGTVRTARDIAHFLGISLDGLVMNHPLPIPDQPRVKKAYAINAFEYHRRKQHISIAELSKRTGLCWSTVSKKSLEAIENMNLYDLIRVASALGITLEDAIRPYDRRDLTPSDRPKRVCVSVNLQNPIYIYKEKNNLTYQSLAHLLGMTTREGARQACARKKAADHLVLRLAAHEHIKLEDFFEKYSITASDTDKKNRRK